MRTFRIVRAMKVLCSGALLLQIGGCSSLELIQFIQTILLGITAAGAVAIIQNI